MKTAREDDPELGDMQEMMAAWYGALGLGTATLRQAIELATTPMPQADENGDMPPHGAKMALPHPDLQDVFMRVAGARGVIDAKKLGYWMQSHQGRVLAISLTERLRFQRDGATQGVARWRLSRSGATCGGGRGG